MKSENRSASRNNFGSILAGIAVLTTLSCVFPVERVRAPYRSPAEEKVPPSVQTQEKRVQPPDSGTADTPLRLTVEHAILTTLENNPSIRVARLDPEIRRTFEQEALSIFDPVITGTISALEIKREAVRAGDAEEVLREVRGEAAVSKFFPTGTDVTASLGSLYQDSSLLGDQSSARLGLTVTQALLRGAGVRVNMVDVEQARILTGFSEYELRGFTENLVGEVERTYWEYALALRRIEIFTESLQLAERQLAETTEIVEIGRLAEIELVAGQAEIALRRQDLINARSALAAVRLRFLRLLSLSGEKRWEHEIELLNLPFSPEKNLDPVEDHVRVALRMRPDLNQARLLVKRDMVELVRTRNGLLPRLDFFLTLGQTGYSDSFGNAIGRMIGDGYDIQAGASFSYPVRNRRAEALHRRAGLGRDQSVEALDNLARLVEEDVRAAYIEVERAREQIAASAASSRLQEEKLAAETERFRVGTSTAFQVAQAQRDLVSSQIAEVQAVVENLTAIVALFRLEGSLLERRGVAAPGRLPVSE